MSSYRSISSRSGSSTRRSQSNRESKDFGNWYNGASPYALSHLSDVDELGKKKKKTSGSSTPSVILVDRFDAPKVPEPVVGPGFTLDLTKDKTLTNAQAEELLLKGFNASPCVSTLLNASYWSTEARTKAKEVDLEEMATQMKQKKIDNLSVLLNRNNKPQF